MFANILFRRTFLNMAAAIGPERLGVAGKKPFTVFIEGNIGSGKTTFLNHFEKFKDRVCLLTEPVEKWRDCGGVNLLDLMYKEPHRWAMPFQTYVTLTMLNMHTYQTDKSVKLMERSMFSARFHLDQVLFELPSELTHKEHSTYSPQFPTDCPSSQGPDGAEVLVVPEPVDNLWLNKNR